MHFSAISTFSSQLKLCGENITDEDLSEKTFSTFDSSNVLLHQQYHEKDFMKSFELVSCLLVSEQNNELLMKNHEFRPIGSIPFREVNVVANQSTYHRRGWGHGQGQGHGYGQER